MSAVDLDDVKAHLNMTSDANNDELQQFIDVAEAAISTRTGPLTPVEVTEKHAGGGTMLVLRRPRAVSLTSITYGDGSTSNLSDYDLDPDTAIVYWNANTAGRFPGCARNVVVTYQAGFAALPADLTHAVKELVRHLWKTQRGNVSGARPGFQDSDDPAADAGAYESWPRRVQQLVDPYIVPSIA